MRLVRLRLRLALLTMAVLPMALSMALVNAFLGPRRVDLALELLAIMGALSVLLVALTVRMTHQVLRPAEDLERSRADLHRQYELARADTLRDSLTGLGNHRAFQEELDRELESYRRYRVPVALLLIDLDDLRLVNDFRGTRGR